MSTLTTQATASGWDDQGDVWTAPNGEPWGRCRIAVRSLRQKGETRFADSHLGTSTLYRHSYEVTDHAEEAQAGKIRKSLVPFGERLRRVFHLGDVAAWPVPSAEPVHAASATETSNDANGADIDLLTEAQASAGLNREPGQVNLLIRKLPPGVLTPVRVYVPGAYSFKNRYRPSEISRLRACLATADLLAENGVAEPINGHLWVLEIVSRKPEVLDLVDLCADGDMTPRRTLANAAEKFKLPLDRLRTGMRRAAKAQKAAAKAAEKGIKLEAKPGLLRSHLIYGAISTGLLIVSDKAVDKFKLETTPPKKLDPEIWKRKHGLQKMVGVQTERDCREVSEQAELWVKQKKLVAKTHAIEQPAGAPIRPPNGGAKTKVGTKTIHIPKLFDAPTFLKLWQIGPEEDKKFIREQIKKGDVFATASNLHAELEARGCGVTRRHKLLQLAGAIYSNVAGRPHYTLDDKRVRPREPRLRLLAKDVADWIIKQLKDGPLFDAEIFWRAAKKSIDQARCQRAFPLTGCTRENVARSSRNPPGLARFWLLPGQSPPTPEQALKAIEEYERKAQAEAEASGTVNGPTSAPSANGTALPPMTAGNTGRTSDPQSKVPAGGMNGAIPEPSTAGTTRARPEEAKHKEWAEWHAGGLSYGRIAYKWNKLNSDNVTRAAVKTAIKRLRERATV